MTLNSLIRKIHLYIGLQALLALGLFSIATIAATFHSEDDLDWEVSRQDYSGRTDLGVRDLAQAVHTQVGRRYENAPRKWMLSDSSSEKVSFKYFSPNGTRIVTLFVPDREIEISSHRFSFAMYLNRMHTESLGRRKSGDEFWLWAWSLYIELSLFALFLLPVTGLYIWLLRRNKQGWAKLSLVISGSLMLLVFYSVMIRNLHLLFGFLSIPFLLVYAVSAVFFAHPVLDPSANSSVIHEFEAKPYGSNREQLLAKFLAENNIRGEIISEESFADGSSLISINHPSKNYKVTYYPAENRIQLNESTKNITGFLKALHKTSGIDNTDWELNAWGIYILIEAVLLLLIVISGIYLWLQRSYDRKSGLVFLLTSLLFGASLLTIIRLG